MNNPNPNVKVRLIVDLNDNGSVTVNGPINDKVLCFGLLETAKDCVREFIAKQEKQTIQIAQPHPLLNLKGGH